MTAQSYAVPEPAIATCTGCGKSFIPPVLPSRQNGKATICRQCARAALTAAAAAERAAYTAITANGIVTR